MRAGLKTYVSDLWNVAEIMSYIFFITAFVSKVQMNFVQSEIIEDLFDELLTMNVQNGTDIAASEELLHQHQLTEGRLAVSGGQPHLSDLAIDPKYQVRWLPCVRQDSIQTFEYLTFFYSFTLIPNSFLMWFKL